ncbi:MAG: hypothetical protein K2X82_03275 [Gemmataceae bacterium]|nr:hypothetical protein [Gemmataceae bacterium]
MLVLQGERERVEVVRFGPDGTTLVAPTYKGVQVWRGLPAPGPPAVIGDYRYAGQVAVTPDGRLFVDGATFAVHDLRTGASRPVVLWGEYGAYFAISPDGRFLVVGQNHRDGPAKATLACRPTDNLSPGAAVWTLPITHRIDAGPVFLGPDRFAVHHGYWDEAARRGVDRYVTRDLRTGAVLADAEGPHADAPTFAADPDGRFLACGRTNRVVVVEAADPGREVAVLKAGRKFVTGLAFHPSARVLATASNDRTVRFWDTASWTATTFEWGAGRMRSVAFSPDGTLAAAGTDDGRVVVWDVDL